MSRLLRFCLLAVVAAVVNSAPCAAPTAPATTPCVPRTTKTPCAPRTTTTTTTTTTTPAPCETTTVAQSPCEPTTVAFNPCQTTTTTTTTAPAPCETTTVAQSPCEPITVAFNPCLTTTTTTTPAPCETTTVALSPCETTTVAQNPCEATVFYSPQEVHKETKKDGINWTQYDANRIEKEKGVQIDPLVMHTFKDTVCRDGWTRYQESCYFVSREEKKSLRKAEEHCRDLESTLFVPNSQEELKTILENAPANTWTWLGLHKENEQEKAHWHVSDALDIAELNWLNNNPYGDGINGWTSISQCAAHWNPTTIGKYAFWYPCNYDFHYICERNSTRTPFAIDHLF